MRPPLPPNVATFEDNPIGGLSTGELLLAVAVVGAVGLGIYYATKPKVALVTSSTQAATGILRPNTIGNTFNSSSATPIAVPAGPQITVVNGQQLSGFVLTPGQYITFLLPAGATWMGVKIGNSSTNVNSSVNLGSDLTSPVSIPTSALLAVNANVVVPTWKVGAAGSQQAAFYGVFVT